MMETKTKNERVYLQAVFPTTWNLISRAGWATKVLYWLGIVGKNRTGYAEGRYYLRLRWRKWHPLYWVLVVTAAVARTVWEVVASLWGGDDDVELTAEMPLKMRERRFNDPTVVTEDMDEDLRKYDV